MGYQSKTGTIISGRYTVWTIAFLVAIITFVVYIPALENSFVNWDDHAYVYENRDIESINLKLLSWNPGVVLWHPLTMLSLAIDHALWGLNPWGYHLTNVVLHALNALLVFVITTRLVIEYDRSPAGGIEHPLPGDPVPSIQNKSIIIASVTAVLFGIHPLHVESVAWISERKDVLYAFFYLLSLLAYLRYAVYAVSGRYIYYGISLLFFVFALLSKPMAVTLPLVLIIIDLFPLRRLTLEKGFTAMKLPMLEKLPFIFFALLFSLVTIWAHKTTGTLNEQDIPPFLARVSVVGWAYISYLAKMILPVNMAPLYPYTERIEFFTIKYMGSSILLSIATLHAVRSFKRNMIYSSLWLYYLITLIPVIGLVQVGRYATADRFTYLPSLGPFIFVGLVVNLALERVQRRIYRAVIFFVLFLLAGILVNITIKQITVWHDSVTLWTHQIKLFPKTVTAYYNRGLALSSMGRYEEAIKDYSKASEVDPKFKKALGNYGDSRKQPVNPEQAISDYSRVIENDPKEADAYYRRGLALGEVGRYSEAIKDLDRAIELNPKNADAYYSRGNAYGALNNFQQAIVDYSRAIGFNPQFARAFNNRGAVFVMLRDYQKAIIDYTMAIGINPQTASIYYNRGDAYFKSGDYDRAIKDFSKAVLFSPGDGEAYYQIGLAYSMIKDAGQAVFYYKKAARLGSQQAQDYLRSQGISWQ